MITKTNIIDSGNHFGWNIDIDEYSIIIGAPDEDSCAVMFNGNAEDNECIDSGAAYIFRKTQDGK